MVGSDTDFERLELSTRSLKFNKTLKISKILTENVIYDFFFT